MNPNAEIEKLLIALDSDDWSTRWNAIRSLGELKAVEAVAKLSSCLDDPDPDIHVAAEEALLKIASPEATDSVVKYGIKRVERARDTLLNRNQSLDARLASLELLWERKPEDLASILENCIDDPDQKLQQRAFKYFSSVTTANHIPRYPDQSGGPLPKMKTMPEKVEFAIAPSEVRSCLVLGRRLPEEMPTSAKAKFMSGLWDMAKKHDPALASMLLSAAKPTPVNVETFLVQSSGVDFTTASAAAARQWMDRLLPTMSQPHYRMFAFPSHAMIREERYDFVFLVLVFGRRSDKQNKKETGGDTNGEKAVVAILVKDRAKLLDPTERHPD